MKLQCRCGNLVIDSDSTQKYQWMTTSEWMSLLDTVNTEIEQIKDATMLEAAIMHIRDAAGMRSAWECPKCKRILTLCNGDVVYLLNESAASDPEQ